jgi:hypothetical protein
MKAFRAVVMWVALVGVTMSCGCTQYGARRYPIELHTKPEGATLYLVRYDHWLRSGGEEAFIAGQRPDSFKALNSPSPTTTECEAYQWILLGELMTPAGIVLRGRSEPFTPSSRFSKVEVVLR